MTNSAKLKGKMIESGLNQTLVAEQLGMTIATFNYKVNNKTEFKANEIKKLSEILHLTNDEVNTIFFCRQGRMIFYSKDKTQIFKERMVQK